MLISGFFSRGMQTHFRQILQRVSENIPSSTPRPQNRNIRLHQKRCAIGRDRGRSQQLPRLQDQRRPTRRRQQPLPPAVLLRTRNAAANTLFTSAISNDSP